MLSKKSKDIFQDYMPNNICFGCGNNTKDGLHIKSYWQDEIAECIWTPKTIHQGWRGIMNGGIIATVIDCHAMGTSMAYAYKHENRSLGSSPEYKYATGTMKIKYLKPTPNNTIKLKARILSYSERKFTFHVKSYLKEMLLLLERLCLLGYTTAVKKIQIFLRFSSLLHKECHLKVA